jgi:hypothetical protein
VIPPRPSGRRELLLDLEGEDSGDDPRILAFESPRGWLELKNVTRNNLNGLNRLPRRRDLQFTTLVLQSTLNVIGVPVPPAFVVGVNVNLNCLALRVTCSMTPCGV